VTALTEVVDVAMGGYYSCVRAKNGKTSVGLYCFGANNMGQLGTGAVTNEPALVPKLILDGQQVTTVVASWSRTCATFATGTASCWGDCSTYACSGSYGNGFMGSPTANSMSGVTGGLGVVTAPNALTCAWSAAGDTYCMGLNSLPALGIGPLAANASPEGKGATHILPDKNGLNQGVTAMATNGLVTCAVLKDGTLACWGKGNNTGSLGNGSDFSAVPAKVVLP
jgi:alpha-tubulin suppressor-like RCC1 family protein